MNIAVMRSGRHVDLDKPARAAILAADIAEQLAKLPMYRGATWNFYSMAQHSCLVAQEVARAEGEIAALYALLHHAPHVFGADAQDVLMQAVCGAFDLDWPPPDSIARALAHVHDAVTLTELRQICTGREEEVQAMLARGITPLKSGMIRPKAWDKAYDRFIEDLRVYAVAAQLPKLPALEGVL